MIVFFNLHRPTITRVAGFYFVCTAYQTGKSTNDLNISNGQKLYQMVIKYTKWSYNIPNVNKIPTYTKNVNSLALKNIPK
jgi:hypothetical protein